MRCLTLLLTAILATVSSESLFAQLTEFNAEQLGEKISALAQPIVDDDQVVGISVGVWINGDQAVYNFGKTDLEKGTLPTADTIYEIGSITKVFTAVMLSELIERDQVKLDGALQSYLPDDVNVPTYGESPIQLLHLATHTSGLPRLPSNLAYQGKTDPYAGYDRAMLFQFLPNHELRRPPGIYEYSNLGAGLLGQILADRAEVSYESLLLERICKPLHLGDTCIQLSDARRSRFATPYDTALRKNYPWTFDALAGAGAIRSTARDLLKFAEANMDPQSPLAETLTRCHTPRMPIGNGTKIALGWHIARDQITRWHNGMTGGYAGWLSIVPDHNIAVVALSNTASTSITELGENVTRLSFGIDVEPKPRRKAIELDTTVLKRYEGRYRILPIFILDVRVEGGQLTVKATGQDRFPVFPESDTEFFYRVVDAQISFHVNDDGEVEALTLHQNGQDMRAPRLPDPVKSEP